MPRATIQSNQSSAKVPPGKQETRRYTLCRAPLTRPPALRQKLLALLDTSNARLSQRLKRKLDDDDHDLLEICKDIVAHVADDGIEIVDDVDDDSNEANSHGSTNINDEVGWIGRWIESSRSLKP